MSFDYSNYKNLMAQNAYSNYAKAQPSPQKTGGTEQVFAPKQQPEVHKKSGANGSTNEELAQIRDLGMQKAQGFQNGLGGTNNPDDHRLFLTA